MVENLAQLDGILNRLTGADDKAAFFAKLDQLPVDLKELQARSHQDLADDNEAAMDLAAAYARLFATADGKRVLIDLKKRFYDIAIVNIADLFEGELLAAVARQGMTEPVKHIARQLAKAARAAE